MFIGGQSTDSVTAITVFNGRLYVVGSTASFNFPTRNPIFTVQGSQDSFLNVYTLGGMDST